MQLSHPAINSFSASLSITGPLVNSILLGYSNEHNLDDIVTTQSKLKLDYSLQRNASYQTQATELMKNLPPNLQSTMEFSCQDGASSWLSALPLKGCNFRLHKSSFRDALCLRYGWDPPRLPPTCTCVQPFTVDHCMSQLPSRWLYNTLAQ